VVFFNSSQSESRVTSPESKSSGASAVHSLFRQEAIDAQRDHLFGEVSLVKPLPVWMFTALALTFGVLLLAFLFWGQYSRRERVDGFLDLDEGVARIQVKDAGTLADIYVHEGDEVDAGAMLAKVTYERGTKGGTSASQLVANELNERMAGLAREQLQAIKLGEQQAEQVKRRIADLEKELMQIDVEMKLQRTRIASAQELADRYQQLASDKFVSDIVAQQKRDDVTDQQVKLEGLKRQRTTIERDLRSAAVDIRSAETRTQGQVEQLKRQSSELQQNLVQEESSRESVLRAPVSGVVTNIALNRGQSVSADAAFATIVPKGGGLHAQLLVPTRAIGFVQPGQAVELRYEAFPYQRFGQYRGKVIGASRTVWSAGERMGPLAAREPVYRVDVELAQQQVGIGEQHFELRPGMLVNADILLERRSVFEWLFEPVLAFREQLRTGSNGNQAEGQ
jgi:membrane fusion protein